MASHRRHPVIREDRQAGLGIPRPGHGQQVAERRLIRREHLLHVGVVFDVLVQEGVDLAEIQEEERRPAGGDVLAGPPQDLLVAEPVVRVHVVRPACRLSKMDAAPAMPPGA